MQRALAFFTSFLQGCGLGSAKARGERVRWRLSAVAQEGNGLSRGMSTSVLGRTECSCPTQVRVYLRKCLKWRTCSDGAHALPLAPNEHQWTYRLKHLFTFWISRNGIHLANCVCDQWHICLLCVFEQQNSIRIDLFLIWEQLLKSSLCLLILKLWASSLTS
jgi:hypothetical protein